MVEIGCLFFVNGVCSFWDLGRWKDVGLVFYEDFFFCIVKIVNNNVIFFYFRKSSRFYRG